MAQEIERLLAMPKMSPVLPESDDILSSNF